MPLGIHHFPNSTQKSRPSLRTRNGEQHEISRARKIERRFFFLQRPHSQPRESNHTSSQLFEIEQPHQPAVKLLPRSHLRTCKPEHGPKSTTVHNDPLLHLPPKATNQNTETCGPRDAPGGSNQPTSPNHQCTSSQGPLQPDQNPPPTRNNRARQSSKKKHNYVSAEHRNQITEIC